MQLREKIKITETTRDWQINAIVGNTFSKLGWFKKTLLSIKTENTTTVKNLLNQDKSITDKDLDVFFPEKEKQWLFGRIKASIGSLFFDKNKVKAEILTLLQSKQNEVKTIIAESKTKIDELKKQMMVDPTVASQWDETNKNPNDDSETDGDTKTNSAWQEEWDGKKNKKDKNKKKEKKKEKKEWKWTEVALTGAVTGVLTTSTVVGNKLILRNRAGKLEKALQDQIKNYKKTRNALKESKKYSPERLNIIKRNIDGMIKHTETAIKDSKLLKSSKAMSMWKNLSKANILDSNSINFFTKIKPENAKKILDIAKNPAQLKKLQELSNAGKGKEIRKMLKLSNDISKQELKGIVGVIAKTKTAKQLKQLWTVLSEMKPLARFAKFGRAMPYVGTLLFSWLELWTRYGNSEAAEQIMKNNLKRWRILKSKAMAHLIVGGSGIVATGLVTMLASSGPVGWIGLGIWAGVMAASEAIDALYYNVQEVYSLNKHSLQEKQVAEIRQIILQMVVSKENTLPKSVNEKIANYITEIKESQKIDVMDAAFSVLLENSTINNQSIDKNSPEGKEQQEKYDQEIKIRQKYIADNRSNPTFVKACTLGDMNAVPMMIKRSENYYNMRMDKDFDKWKGMKWYHKYLWQKVWYLTAKDYEEKEKNDNLSIEQKQFHTLSQMSDEQYYAMYYQLIDGMMDQNGGYSNYKDSPTYDNIVKNATFFQEYHKFRSYNTTPAQIPDVQTMDEAVVLDFLSHDTLTHDIKITAFNKSEIIKKYTWWEINKTINPKEHLERSDDVSQNIMYRIAKMMGYTWPNRRDLLLQNYSEKNANVNCFYVSGTSFGINNDRAIDESLDLNLLKDPNKSTEEILQELMAPSAWNYLIDAGIILGTWGIAWVGILSNWGLSSSWSAGLDTPTETIDDNLNMSFWQKVLKIIAEERQSIEKPETKEQKNQIAKNYIQKYATEWYINLPPSLWPNTASYENIFFKYEDWKVVALLPKSYEDTKITFADQVEIIHDPYDKLTESEKQLRDQEIKKQTDYVEEPLKKLNALLRLKEDDYLLWFGSGNANHYDSLDIPPMYKTIIANKINSRTRLKESLKSYQPEYAKFLIKEQRDEFHDRFTNMYISLLDGIEGNYVSDDQDSPEVMQEHLRHASFSSVYADSSNKNISVTHLGKKYNLNPEPNAKDADGKKIEEPAPTSLTSVFFKLIKKYKFDYEWQQVTCQQLLESDYQVEAQHYAKVLWMSILETESIIFQEKNGEMTLQTTDKNRFNMYMFYAALDPKKNDNANNPFVLLLNQNLKKHWLSTEFDDEYNDMFDNKTIDNHRLMTKFLLLCDLLNKNTKKGQRKNNEQKILMSSNLEVKKPKLSLLIIVE